MAKRKQEARKWRNRIVGHGEEDAGQPLANPRNWRIHPKEQQAALEGVLAEVGWVQDVIVNQRTGFVVDGHARVALAISAGEKVPVVYVDLSEEEERLILATLDPLSAMAVTDKDLLGDLLKDLDVTNEAVKAMLAGLQPVAKQGLTDPDEVPAVPVAPVSRLGDLWLMGGHRLLCADSTDAECLTRLVDGHLADMIFMDPPYGVDFGVANHNPRAKRWAKIKNDDKKGGELGEFLEVCFRTLLGVCIEAAPMYCWSAPMGAGYDMLLALQSAGFHVQSQIVWVKNCIVLGQADYQWRHEPCWYGWTPGKNHYWAGGRILSMVWEHSKDSNQSYEHPAQKPVSLSVAAIGNSCPFGGVVIDIFAGSGSTLIGCEKTDRRARLMEIDPGYCDVIVLRWQNFTGKKAMLDGHDGLTFESVKAGRRLEAEDAIKEEVLSHGKT